MSQDVSHPEHARIENIPAAPVLPDDYPDYIDEFRGGGVLHIDWQKGTLGGKRPNGAQPEDVLLPVIERLKYLLGRQYSFETSMAIRHVEGAIICLRHRTRDRTARGVEGTEES